MSAIQSQHRGLKSEDRAIERDYRRSEKLMGDEGSLTQNDNETDDDNDMMIAGDVHVTVTHAEPKAAETTAQPSPSPVPSVAPAAKSLVATVAPWALGAALGPLGFFAGNIVTEMLKDNPPAVVQPENETPAEQHFTDTAGTLQKDK